MHDDGLGFVKVGHPARGIEKDLAPEVPRQVHGLVVQELVQRTAHTRHDMMTKLVHSMSKNKGVYWFKYNMDSTK